MSVAQKGYVAPRKSSETAKYEYENSHYTNSTFNKVTIVNIPVTNKDDRKTIESLVTGADITDDEYYRNLIDTRNAEFIRNGVLPPSADGWRSLIKTLKENEWPAKRPTFYSADSGYATAKHHNSEGVIDSAGHIIIPIIWGRASTFHNGLAYVTAPGYKGKTGFMDKTNTLAIPLKYEDCWLGFSQGLAPVKYDGKWGFIDVNDLVVVPFIYESAKQFDKDGYAVVQKKKKLGMINIAGKEMIPIKYQQIYKGGYENLYSCQLKDKWGVVSIETGETIIEPIYETYVYFFDGKAKVTLKGRTFYIDKTGAEVPAP